MSEYFIKNLHQTGRDATADLTEKDDIEDFLRGIEQKDKFDSLPMPPAIFNSSNQQLTHQWEEYWLQGLQVTKQASEDMFEPLRQANGHSLISLEKCPYDSPEMSPLLGKRRDQRSGSFKNYQQIGPQAEHIPKARKTVPAVNVNLETITSASQQTQKQGCAKKRYSKRLDKQQATQNKHLASLTSQKPNRSTEDDARFSDIFSEASAQQRQKSSAQKSQKSSAQQCLKQKGMKNKTKKNLTKEQRQASREISKQVIGRERRPRAEKEFETYKKTILAKIAELKEELEKTEDEERINATKNKISSNESRLLKRAELENLRQQVACLSAQVPQICSILAQEMHQAEAERLIARIKSEVVKPQKEMTLTVDLS